MNQVEKPKKVKLWKSSMKKMKVQENKSDIKFKTAGKSNVNENKISGKAVKHQESKKRKNDFQNQSPKKKMKPDDMSRKDWKLLHMDKKKKVSSEAKESDNVSASANNTEKRPEHMTGKEWKKYHMKKKGKSDVFEAGEKLKSFWEDFRRSDCKPEEKKKLLKKICNLLKGRVKEFTFAHDTVRVLESVVTEGTAVERDLLFEELKSDIVRLVKSKYGKFIVMKILKYGSKEQKNLIMKTFHGKVIKLIRHTEAAVVIESAFNECANSVQRVEFVQEFYGPSFTFFKDLDCHNLKQLLEKQPEKKATILENMKTELIKVLEKSVVKHSIVHNVLWQFMQHADPASKSEVIESLREAIPEILHTKEGSRVAMHCVWFGTAKDRKVIVKSMKTFVCKIAMEEFGHMVLLALFDCCDDTKLLIERIVKELSSNILEIAQNTHGVKVLSYLLNRRDSHYIHPDVCKILQTGDANETSKKDPKVRHEELKASVSQLLLNLVRDNIKSLYKNNSFCLFTKTILQHATGDKYEAFQAIAAIAAEPYTTENKNVHIVENQGSCFLLKQLILLEKNLDEDEKCTFSTTLISNVPSLGFKSWIDCNRGAFLLVSLLETGMPSVMERIIVDLKGCKKYLAKKLYRGAEILLKQLKTIHAAEKLEIKTE